MNKKGDLSVTLLVIGVFVVCTLAMVLFFVSGVQDSKSFVKVGLIEKLNSRIEQGDSTVDGTGKNPEGKEVPYLEEKSILNPMFGESYVGFYVRHYK